MKSGLVLLAMCVALSGFCCSPPRSEMAGGKCKPGHTPGGRCAYKPKCDASGGLIDVDTDPPCFKGKAEGASALRVNGEPLIEKESQIDWITFGTGTSTCYGPPIPSPPICICTKAPCP